MNGWYRFVLGIARLLLRILFPMKVVGLENIPAGQALLCANHVSAWDPIMIAAAMPKGSRLYIMAKEELFRSPIANRFLRSMLVFPVKRGGNDLGAMRTAMHCLDAGGQLLVFPEGTRVKEQPVEAKGGAAVLAARASAPLLPVYCGGKKQIGKPVTVVFGKPYHPQFAGKRPTAEETQRISGDLLDRIYGLSEGTK